MKTIETSAVAVATTSKPSKLALASLYVPGSGLRFTIGKPTRARIEGELKTTLGQTVTILGEEGKLIKVTDGTNEFAIKRANLGSLVGEDGKMKTMTGTQQEWKHQPGSKKKGKVTPEVEAAKAAMDAYLTKNGGDASALEGGKARHFAKLTGKLEEALKEAGLPADHFSPVTEA